MENSLRKVDQGFGLERLALHKIRLNFVFIFDANGKLVRHPLDNQSRPFVQDVGGDRVIGLASHDEGDPETDFISLHFDQPLGRPLSVAEHLAPAAVIYNVGFPGLTGGRYVPVGLNFSRTPFPDSNGISQRLTSGPAQQYLKVKKAIRVHVDADCMRGMSGGPMLNENGEVVGIVSQGVPQDLPEKKVSIYGVRPVFWPVALDE